MRMRAPLRSLPARLSGLIAVVLYALLGVGAAWHAPHFTEGEIAVHVDRHTGGHEKASVEDCALCTWKAAAQETASADHPVVRAAEFASSLPSHPQIVAVGHFRAALARGPPSLS
jgi:hypothetical protein